MKIILFIFAVIFAVLNISAQTPLEGVYMVGDKKATIKMDDYAYYITIDGIDGRSLLQYEENTPENDQIWLVWKKGNQQATIVFRSDYSSGMYTNYRTSEESYVKKIE